MTHHLVNKFKTLICHFKIPAPKVTERVTKTKGKRTKRSKVAEKATSSKVVEQAPIEKVVGANTPLRQVTFKQLQEALMSGNLVLVDADVNTTLKSLEDLSNAPTSAPRQPQQPQPQ